MKKSIAEIEAIDAEVERRFLAAVGTVVKVTELTGYIGDTDQQGEFFTTPEDPFEVRVLPTDRQSLRHWTDDDHCDPYWDVEVVAPHAKLPPNLRSVWVFGSSPTDEVRS